MENVYVNSQKKDGGQSALSCTWKNTFVADFFLNLGSVREPTGCVGALAASSNEMKRCLFVVFASNQTQ